MSPQKGGCRYLKVENKAMKNVDSRCSYDVRYRLSSFIQPPWLYESCDSLQDTYILNSRPVFLCRTVKQPDQVYLQCEKEARSKRSQYPSNTVCRKGLIPMRPQEPAWSFGLGV
ncbi:uncharacterized protein TrAFT101_008848 [Trichoderma asperellum]|uniref:uncharacterized protein n=1 Tax=Trichoderma asperellum TaxID=101201 RepID=UPI00332C47AB|nr:hypothetical protein TrAFT101_008848 [Trichoderma asperellum]